MSKSMVTSSLDFRALQLMTVKSYVCGLSDQRFGIRLGKSVEPRDSPHEGISYADCLSVMWRPGKISDL